MIVLKAAAVNRFRSVGGFWVSELFQCGLVFKELGSGNTLLSLGTYAGGCLSWELKPVGEKYFQLSDDGQISPQTAAIKLQSFATNALAFPNVDTGLDEEYAGIPTRVCLGPSCSCRCC